MEQDHAAFILRHSVRIGRLAALVLRPRLNPGSSPGQVLTRFHGIFAPNFRHRHRIVPRRTRGTHNGFASPLETYGSCMASARACAVDSDKPLALMTWAQRLKSAFPLHAVTSLTVCTHSTRGRATQMIHAPTCRGSQPTGALSGPGIQNVGQWVPARVEMRL